MEAYTTPRFGTMWSEYESDIKMEHWANIPLAQKTVIINEGLAVSQSSFVLSKKLEVLSRRLSNQMSRSVALRRPELQPHTRGHGE